MYLLDTNIVSLLDSRRRRESASIVDWIERNGPYLFFSVATLTEMEIGILKLRRSDNIQRADGLAVLLEGIIREFGERILPMNKEVALRVARLDERARAFAPGMSDLIIAATADVAGLILLTRNVRDFAPMGVRLVDPFVALPGER